MPFPGFPRVPNPSVPSSNTPPQPGPHSVDPTFVKMQGSVPRTLRVNMITDRNPTVLYAAANVPLRIVVRNVGPATAFLATDFAEAISSSGLPGAATMLLPVDTERVVILAPRQKLYATCLVVGRVTLMASDAWPVV